MHLQTPDDRQMPRLRQAGLRPLRRGHLQGQAGVQDVQGAAVYGGQAMTRPYRPADGTEGMDFMDQFCGRCRHYAARRGCPILNATLAWNPRDLEYPNQWVQDDDGENARCVAFQEE